MKDKISEEMMKRGRVAGLMKAAEICLYHKGKSAGLTEAYKAGCNEVYVSCLATADRIERGEYENPTSSVTEAAQSSKPEWPTKQKFIEEMGLRKFEDERSEYGEGYDMGALDAFDYLKQKLTPSQGEG